MEDIYGLDKLNITEYEKKMLNDWVGFFSFKPTWAFNQLIRCEEDVICLFTGNQAMKTSNVAYWNVMSVLGLLPVYHKNINPEDPIRILRFASEVLPGDTGKGGKEVRNTQYPEFKKWLPPSLIKKDITFRSPVMTLNCPRGGPDIMVEFVSFNQDVQAQAGVQRRRVWIDEHCKKDFYQEQMPRLLAAGGDIVFTLTPAQEYLDWEYDEFYEEASRVIRTPSIIKRIKDRTGEDVKQIEERDTGKSIVVLMAATDDNPTLDPETIDKLFAQFGDEEVVDIRRYGLFKQISGRIFKQFDKRIHVIDRNKYFPDGIPYKWLHARGIDYHEHNPWAIGWMSLSPTNEAFIWREYYPSPENHVTLDIARNTASLSEDYRFALDLIDPLAAKKQPNTGFSVVDDLNRIFLELKMEGLGTGASWKTWDTKSTVGRDAIRMRLTNSRLCGVPFNNRRLVNDREEYLPTIWICNDCRNAIDFMLNWKREEWLNREMALLKDSKDSPQQKWSHFNMVWEAIFKDTFFDPRALRNGPRENRNPYRESFKG